MRMSRAEAAENRKKVVQTASELFREQGYDGIGIAGLMAAAGLTHGGFYKKFASKEALITEATAAGLAENAVAWQTVLDRAGDEPLADFSRWYLSEDHITHRDKGCTYATLACEAPRHGPDLRQAFEDGLKTSVDQLSGASGMSQAEAIREMSRLIGALILARAVEDPALAEQIVSANLERKTQR
ncbi:TetR/AcrR family transcriptional regulator [Celeribacter neptunius]|uniref:Transcriptional regulator, TetR family n=1 Tax=Celeribacter neptunius TaxID=588602 RepID=A0A1I3LJT4_9RHOB|nr:TetR/AcrR family transcriptional regulator [Celeribacter neptunius]SFI84957.1 transcriptional regulator, TetR family [Celeribacter neptunius]